MTQWLVSQLKTKCGQPRRLGVPGCCCPQGPEAHLRLCCQSGTSTFFWSCIYVTWASKPLGLCLDVSDLEMTAPSASFGSPSLPSSQIDQNWNIREIKETLKTLSKEQGLVKKKLQRTHRSKIYLLCAYRRQWKSLFSSSSYEVYAPETCVWQTLLVAHPTESSFN